MKTTPLAVLALILPLNAGTTSKESPPGLMPQPPNLLLRWFAGGSVGYLTELEEPTYDLIVGVESQEPLAGWRFSMFAQIGYTQRDESYSGGSTFIPLPGAIDFDRTFDLDDLEDGLKDSAETGLEDTDYTLRILPITYNIKVERPIYANLSGYFGVGLGVAWVDLDADAGSFGSFSDDDWVFAGQVFGGLSYKINDHFDVFGGVRWLYLSEAQMGSGSMELDDNVSFELGALFKF